MLRTSRNDHDVPGPKTPLDVMLDNMRWADKGAADLLSMLTEKGAKLPDGFILARELSPRRL